MHQLPKFSWKYPLILTYFNRGRQVPRLQVPCLISPNSLRNSRSVTSGILCRLTKIHPSHTSQTINGTTQILLRCRLTRAIVISSHPNYMSFRVQASRRPTGLLSAPDIASPTLDWASRRLGQQQLKDFNRLRRPLGTPASSAKAACVICLEMRSAAIRRSNSSVRA